MSFSDKLTSSKSGYIFISHSHDDIVKVRRIRNALESEGFEPLCFYLKCLDDDSEIEDLIKREIDAREWFLFVNSENSIKSKWVNLEREYIESTNKKKILTVNLENDNDVDSVIEKISHNLRIFISYSHRDEKIARRINKKLIEKDYLTFFDRDLMQPGDCFASRIASAIIQASQEGCVLLLVSENALASAYIRDEIHFSMEQKGLVIPVVIGNLPYEAMPDWLRFCIGTMQYYSLDADPTDEDIERMIDRIGTAIVKPERF